MPKAELDTFAPNGMKKEAKTSGFFQCSACGLVWFGKPDAIICPTGISSHGRPVHVAMRCRVCDRGMSVEHFAAHLSSRSHLTADSMFRDSY